MALFNGVKPIDGSRSKTHLIKSGHAAPAADLVVSKVFLKEAKYKDIWKEGVLFNYQYGGEGVEKIVIPQGRLVGVCAPEFNFHDQLYKTPIALPGNSKDNNVIGMVPYNIAYDALEDDQFGGNKPGFVTTEYVEIPFLPGYPASTKYDADGIVDEETRLTVENKMPWGAMIGEAYVGMKCKATPSGRVCKWNKGTDCPSLIIGTVIEQNLNQTGWGWIEWMLLNPAELDQMDKKINRSGVSSLPSDYGYPYDPSFREGHGIYDLLNQYQSQFTSNPQGLEGLHDGSGNFDGFGRNDSVYTDMVLGNMPTITKDGTVVIINAVDHAGNRAKNLVADTVIVTVGGTVLDKAKFTVDEEGGAISIEATVAQSTQAVTATYKLMHYGTPSYLDFKDVVGSCSVLLQL